MTRTGAAAGCFSALDRLPAREQRIVQARQLEEEAMTLEELGREFGVSKERVRQLEQRALGRLRKEVLALAGISPRRECKLQRPSRLERRRQRSVVEIVELAAHGQAMGEAA